MLVNFLEKTKTIVYQGLPDVLRKWLLNVSRASNFVKMFYFMCHAVKSIPETTVA